MMRAIILAAGEGTRLRPHTLDRPKCMVELGGKPLLVHQIESLKSAGVEDICIVTGYRADQIEALGYMIRQNPEYDRTNMVASLMCASDLMDGSQDVLVLYADILYEPRIVSDLIHADCTFATSIDKDWLKLWELRAEDPLLDAETLVLDNEGYVTELGKKPSSVDEIQGQYMGLIKFRKDFVGEVVSIRQQMDPEGQYDGKDFPNMYMTSFLQHLIDSGQRLKAVPTNGGWLEVDTTEDLDLYNRLIQEGKLSEFYNIACT